MSLSLYLLDVEKTIVRVKLAQSWCREDSCQPHVKGLIFTDGSSAFGKERPLFMRVKGKQDALEISNISKQKAVGIEPIG